MAARHYTGKGIVEKGKMDSLHFVVCEIATFDHKLNYFKPLKAQEWVGYE